MATARKGSRYVSLGDRLSYEGALCTVRYIGWVEGTEKGLTWFGVEWDDPSRGKHNGSHKGKVYFTCMLSQDHCLCSCSPVFPLRFFP